MQKQAKFRIEEMIFENGDVIYFPQYLTDLKTYTNFRYDCIVDGEPIKCKTLCEALNYIENYKKIQNPIKEIKHHNIH